jgi:hypothetical protein
MSVNGEFNLIVNKTNYAKNGTPIYFSPYAHKKKNFGNLNTEPRKIPLEMNSTSRNKMKQKISNSIIGKNFSNLQSQDAFRKSSKLITETNEKSGLPIKKSMPQSYKKINSKLYLKKNVISNISSFNDLNTHASHTQIGLNSNSKMKGNVGDGSNIKYYKNRATNMKFNLGSKNKETFNKMIKSAGSAAELFNSNVKKTKTKNCSDLKDINPLGYILTNNENNNNKAFFSPQNAPGQKIIFLDKDKNKGNGKYFTHNLSKDSLKVIHPPSPSQTNEQTNNEPEIKNKNSVQYLLRNTYNNVKIYPTTFLNNKIIYQTESNSHTNINNNNNTNTNSNDSSIHYNNSKVKKEIIIIDKNDKKNSLDNNQKNGNAQSVEEIHFLYVITIQNGKNLISQMDKVIT